MHVLVCSECMRTFVHVKERSCAVTAWQLLYRERERERETDRVRRALPDLDLRWQQSNVKKMQSCYRGAMVISKQVNTFSQIMAGC
jgi:hypothetical protein